MAKGGWFGQQLARADNAIQDFSQDTGIGIGDFGISATASSPIDYGISPSVAYTPSYDYNSPIANADFGYLDQPSSPAPSTPSFAESPSFGSSYDMPSAPAAGGGAFPDMSSDFSSGDLLPPGATPAAGPASPPISFGNVQSFGQEVGQASPQFGVPSIDALVSASTAPTAAFDSTGGGGGLTSFTPSSGIDIPSDFLDLTSRRNEVPNTNLSASSLGGFETTDLNTGQKTTGDFNMPAVQPSTISPQQVQPQQSLTQGITPQSVGQVPPAPGSESPYGTNPFTPYGTVNTQQYGEQPPTEVSSVNRATSQAPQAKPSAIEQLATSFMSSLGKNAIGAVASGVAGLYNVSQANKNAAGAANTAGLTSTIPQIQKVIDTVTQQAQQIASQAQPMRDKGGQIINSAQPISEEAQRLMSYVGTGKLPPEYMTQIDEGTKAAKAAAISNAAARGQNVNPGPNGDYSGNSVLQQQLQSIDRQAIILSSTLAQQLYDAGVKGIGASNQTIQAGTGVVNAGNSTQQNATALQAAGLNGIGLQQDVYKKLIDLDVNRSQRVGEAISNFARALGGGNSGNVTSKVA